VNTTTDTPAPLSPALPMVGDHMTVCGITGTVQTVEPASDWYFSVVLLVTDGGGAGVTMTLVIPTDYRTDDGQAAYAAQPARRCTSCDGLGTVAACGCGRPECDQCDRGDAIGCPDCAEGWAYTPTAERPALTGAERRVLQELTMTEAQTPAELKRAMAGATPVAAVRTILARLEVKGYARPVEPNRWVSTRPHTA
jgi:hypothetical protein